MWNMKCILGLSLMATCLQLYIPTIRASHHSFDYYVFSQQWPKSLCINAKLKGIPCEIPDPVNNWVVHGLWPDTFKEHTEPPFFCNSSWPFDQSKLKDIEDQLDIHWPNLYTHTSKYSFWKHEWKKHGTCSEDKPYIFSEKSYFQMGLQLNKKFDVRSLYDKSGILPVTYTSYKCEDFRNVIRKNWNVEAVITCVQDENNKEYILQTELCVDKQFNLIDCSGKIFCQMCSKNGDIYYPPIKDNVIPAFRVV
ncbi:ribonuclease Oy-like isoform X2 [Argonauta hians]